jgi:hypothetical protein
VVNHKPYAFHSFSQFLFERPMTIPLSFEPGSEELPMLDVFLPMMKSAALIAAGQLGIFEALNRGPQSLESLASSLKCESQGLGRLAQMLVAIGYLERVSEKNRIALFQNSPRAARWFTSGGTENYVSGLKWTANAWRLQLALAECVRNGKPDVSVWELMEKDPTWGSTFSLYMHAFAHHLSPDLLAHVEVPKGAKRLLDLGGSHGEHSIAFCKRYENLNAVIVDQGSALTDTWKTIAAANLSERISVRPGDLREVPWGEGYDVVLFLSVMHNQTAEDNRRSIAQVAKVLQVGGTLVIHEYPHDPLGSPFDAAFDLTLLTETGTRMATTAHIETWLNEAGMSVPKKVVLSPKEKGCLFISKRM